MIGMNDATMKRSFTELNYIVNNMSDSLKSKIPIDIIEMINAQMDEDYILNIDITKSYTEQNYMTETKAFLSVLISDYIGDESTRNKWKEFDKTYEDIIRNNTESSINVDGSIDIFGDKKQTVAEESTIDAIDECKQFIEIEKDSLFSRFLKKIKCFFRKL